MDPGLWLALFSVCLLGAISPGPSLAVVINCTLAGGRSAGIAAACAHGLGVALYGLLTVAGLALLVTSSPTLFTALQLAGALYLIYLGARALRAAGGTAAPAAEETATTGAISSGFLVAFLNPKLAVFMLALFSQFLGPQTPVAQKGVMVATVGLTDAAWYCLVAALVSHPAVLAGLRARGALVDRLFGALLLVLGGAVALRVIWPLVAP